MINGVCLHESLHWIHVACADLLVNENQGEDGQFHNQDDVQDDVPAAENNEPEYNEQVGGD